jgi:hypothetical protein
MEITVVKVETIEGDKLKSSWKEPMIVITTEGGYKFIDNMPGKRHSTSTKAWYGYDSWYNIRGTKVEIEITDDWGNKQNNLSTEARYNVWVKHPNVKMVR